MTTPHPWHCWRKLADNQIVCSLCGKRWESERPSKRIPLSDKDFPGTMHGNTYIKHARHCSDCALANFKVEACAVGKAILWDKAAL